MRFVYISHVYPFYSKLLVSTKFQNSNKMLKCRYEYQVVENVWEISVIGKYFQSVLPSFLYKLFVINTLVNFDFLVANNDSK